jgi:hypothetical protein
MQHQAPKHGDAAPSSATRLARARVAPVIDPAPPLPPAAIDVEQRDDGLARALAVSVVQRKTATVPTLVDTAKANLKASIGGNTAKECKTRLAKRFPKGPLFTTANLGDIQALGTADEGRKWLKEVGIGTEADALQYLHDADYKHWLKVSPGKRLLIATIAVRDGIGANDENPPPSYTLGRAMSIQTGGLTGPLNPGAKAQAESERDAQIRDAFVNTLMPVGANELANLNQAWIDQQAVLAANAQAQQVLARILLILQVGLQIYDPAVGAHVDYKTGDVVRALAHGGRVNIRIPALSGTNVNDDAYALTDWIGITANHGATGAVKDRGFGTHHMAIGPNTNGPGTGSFVEEGGKGASMANKRSKGVKLFGLDLAAGGLGKRDFNGDVILPDGGHGHMFIGFTKPTKHRDGALQIGIETTGPGADSLVGYKHNWNSTEATANPESSLYGHKMQKIGGGSLGTNQRLVDLNKVQRDAGQQWTALLTQMGNDLDYDLANAGGNERTLLEHLAGRRS